ncbi:MAG: site-specific integrase [Candidatus Binatia bacterium]|jgi:integrase
MTEEKTVEARPQRAYGDGRVFYRANRGVWCIAYYKDGKEIRETVGTDEDAARKLLKRKVKVKEREDFVTPHEQRITVAELLDVRGTYLTNKGAKSDSWRSHIAVIRKHFGTDRAATVTSDRLERFVAEERATGKAPATVKNELVELRAAYRLAVKQKRIKPQMVPYFPMPTVSNTRKGFFEPEDFESFVQQLPADYADTTSFAYATGWRRGEIVTLKWDQIDRTAHEVRLYDSKNGEPRTLALDGEAWAIIERRWQARAYTPGSRRQPGDGQVHLSEYVFHRKGRPIGDFRKRWDKALKKAGLPTDKAHRKLFHDFRRSGVRDMIRAGVPQSVAMSISGHKTVSTFLRYNITDGKDQRDALRRTAELRRQRVASAPKVTALR